MGAFRYSDYTYTYTYRTMENILGAIYVGKMVIVHRRCFPGRAGPIPGHSRYSSTRFFPLSSQKLFISFLFSSSNTSQKIPRFPIHHHGRRTLSTKRLLCQRFMFRILQKNCPRKKIYKLYFLHGSLTSLFFGSHLLVEMQLRNSRRLSIVESNEQNLKWLNS